MSYPKELPAFEIIKGCRDCKGLHSEGAPTIYGGQRIDVWSCVDFFEPFGLDEIKPLNATAREMIKAVRHGVKYPGKRWSIRV